LLVVTAVADQTLLCCESKLICVTGHLLLPVRGCGTCCIQWMLKHIFMIETVSHSDFLF